MELQKQEFLFLEDEGMKKIDKQESPQWFEDWKNNFKIDNNRDAHYKTDFSTQDTDGTNRRRKLRECFINEQGKICCYCMRRISIDSSHIEHFLPKESFPDKDLLYDNLFASCNGEETIIEEEEHCGHRKDNWWRADMLSPSDVEVEKVFKYFPNGKISSVRGRATSNIAQEMIHNLGLDSFHLERDRKQAIEASEVFDDVEYSEEDIRRFIEYYSRKDKGIYVPYCKAIIDCLEEML